MGRFWDGLDWLKWAGNCRSLQMRNSPAILHGADIPTITKAKCFLHNRMAASSPNPQ